MLKTVELKDIVANPFNARSHYDRDTIKQLADEIAEAGFWPGALRGRKHNGKVELVFGHRRIAALRVLGKKEVQIDIVDLDDAEMAEQGLVENLQREGLTDVERSEGIKALVVRLAKKLGSKEAAYEQIKKMLGYESASTVKILAGVADFEPGVKKLIGAGDGKLRVKDAIAAHNFGKAEMVKTAIEHGITGSKLKAIIPAVNAIADPKVKEKIKAAVIEGKITDAEKVKQKAQAAMLSKAAAKGSAPPDLKEVIAGWTYDLKQWTAKLKEVAPYMEYVEEVPAIAKDFRAACKGLIEALKNLD